MKPLHAEPTDTPKTEQTTNREQATSTLTTESKTTNYLRYTPIKYRGHSYSVVHKQTADELCEHIAPLVGELQASGHSLQSIADELNAKGHTTRRGKPWNRMQVSRVLRRQAVLRL